MLPEANLWSEVILQAIAERSRRVRKRPYALMWLNSESEAEGSFVWACHITNIDPSFVRSTLRKGYALAAGLLRRRLSRTDIRSGETETVGLLAGSE